MQKKQVVPPSQALVKVFEGAIGSKILLSTDGKIVVAMQPNASELFVQVKATGMDTRLVLDDSADAVEPNVDTLNVRGRVTRGRHGTVLTIGSLAVS